MGGEEFFCHCLIFGRLFSFLQWGRMCHLFPQWLQVGVRAVRDILFFFVLLNKLFESVVCGVACETLETKTILLLTFEVDAP